MRMTARDYFFRVVAPEHGEQSYQAAHNFDIDAIVKHSRLGLPLDEHRNALAIAFSHVPRRSNDLLIERLMTELIDASPVDLKERLGAMFVAKLRDYEANAAALHSGDAYEGDLIFFNVGLSDACLQYAIIYYESVRLWGERLSPDRVQPSVGLEARLIEHASKIARAQERWARLGQIRFTPDDVLYSDQDIEETAMRLARCVDKFILGHEVAHHIMGHTNADVRLFSYVDDLPDHCKYWQGASLVSHQREYQADASALMMVLQTADANSKAEVEFDAAIGSLLTLTVLGQLAGDVDNVTSTHPSVSSRFNQILMIRRATCRNDIRGVIFLVKRFQGLLWSIQGRGLGRRWRSDCGLDNAWENKSVVVSA